MSTIEPTADFQAYIAWERTTNDAIDFKKLYVDMAGDLKAGLMLSQIMYWRLPRKNRGDNDTRLTISHEGRRWLAKSDKAWWSEIRLTAKEAFGARRTLESLGIVTLKVKKYAGVPTVHLSINEDRFVELWKQILQIPLQERQAGRVTPRAKRALIHKKGSKPTSGNRRKAQVDEAARASDEVDAQLANSAGETGVGAANYYPFNNNQITKRVITELPKGQRPDCRDGNNGITDLTITYTETPAQMPAETPTEIQTEKKSSIIPDRSESGRAQDDDRLPEGGTPDGMSEDTDAEGSENPLLDQLVWSGVEGGESGIAEGVEEVPAAAEAPVENPGTQGWAILALEPIPLADLQSRPARDPEGLKVLRALMQASSAKRLGHLREQLALPGTYRHLLPRLTDAELDCAAKAASHDAARISGGMSNAGYYALDRLLGKAFTPEMLSGRKPQAPQPALGHAYDVKNEARPTPVQADTPVDAAIEAEGALEAGKIWRQKASGTLVRIERIEGPTIYLDGGESMRIATFVVKYVKYTSTPQQVADD
ncbi:hypothetical protein IHN63_06120 [Deinococcus sp. 6YEL10]|uniref:hypothetical protein n=1 Tax=Deinococcus sp. 6YEL10 TaxID=2745870 RepID=UPI001E5C9C3C|nr:hypothetical protein [Deinococcus sp. 6YEL10]MCD0160885.1 hypothetical protein [Deinococcus sp. 6YEL10]